MYTSNGACRPSHTNVISDGAFDVVTYIRILRNHDILYLPRPYANQWHDATLRAAALMARSGVSVLLKRRTALQLDTLTGLLSQQSEQPTTAEMNAKLAVCSASGLLNIITFSNILF